MPVDFLSRSGDSIRRVECWRQKSGAVCIAFLGYGYLLHAFRIVFGACLDLRRQALVQETGIVASAFARTNIKLHIGISESVQIINTRLLLLKSSRNDSFCDSLKKKARSLTWTLHILSHTGLWMTRGYLVDDSVCNWAARRKCWNYLKRSTDSIHLSLRNIRVSFSPVARQTRFLLVTTKQAV